MYELDQQYLEELETIASEIQESDELARYLDGEEEFWAIPSCGAK